MEETVQVEKSTKEIQSEKPKISILTWIVIVLDFIFGSLLLLWVVILTRSIDTYTFDFAVDQSLLSIAFFVTAIGFLLFRKASIIVGYIVSVLILTFVFLKMAISPFSILNDKLISRIESILEIPPSTWVGFEALGIVIPYLLSLIILFVMLVLSLPLLIHNIKKLNK